MDHPDNCNHTVYVLVYVVNRRYVHASLCIIVIEIYLNRHCPCISNAHENEVNENTGQTVWAG